jgi:hypothetical protein
MPRDAGRTGAAFPAKDAHRHLAKMFPATTFFFADREETPARTVGLPSAGLVPVITNLL